MTASTPPPPRRIVFSRKGLDSGCASSPSPIVDGRPISLPIPIPTAPGAVLTAPGERCARWAAPPWLERSRMSHRPNEWSWPAPGRMDAQGQWQEGVATADEEAVAWAGALIAGHAEAVL